MRWNYLRALVVAATMLTSGYAKSAPPVQRPSPGTWAAHARGRSLVRISTQSPQQILLVRGLGLDVVAHDQHEVVALTTPQSKAALIASGLPWSNIVANLEPTLDAAQDRLAQRHHQGGASFFTEYRDLDEAEAWLEEVAATHPGLVELIEIGTSVEGRSIWAAEIGDTPNPDAPVVLVTGGHHAREWISVMGSLCLLDALITANDPDIGSLLAAARFVVVPIVNPDGYVYTWTTDRFWRKNRRDGIGVDTNRNFATGFGGQGASDVPASPAYHGSAAFSEPESVAVRDLILAEPNLGAYVDLHAYGQKIFYPWGYTSDDPPDLPYFEALALTMQEAIIDAEGISYVGSQISGQAMASGNTVDWIYEQTGAPSFAMELRPSPDGIGGFELPPSEIVGTCADIRSAVIALAQEIAPDAPSSTGGADDTGGVDDTGAQTSGTESGASTSTSGTVDPSGSTGSTTSAEGGTAATQPHATTGSASGATTGAMDTAGQESADGCACVAQPRGRDPWGYAALLAVVLLGPRRRTSTSRRCTPTAPGLRVPTPGMESRRPNR